MVKLLEVKGVPHLRSFHYLGSHYCNFWLMYTQVGDFCVNRGPSTVPLIQILRKCGFLPSPKIRVRQGSSVDNYESPSDNFHVVRLKIRNIKTFAANRIGTLCTTFPNIQNTVTRVISRFEIQVCI
jgi:hypothetical protein